MTPAITCAALVIGTLIPLRWGLSGFLGAAALLFLTQAGLHSAAGFEGTSIEESLLLFNGSWTSYIGFNLQITYRAFALPVLVLAAILIWRMGRAAR